MLLFLETVLLEVASCYCSKYAFSFRLNAEIVGLCHPTISRQNSENFFWKILGVAFGRLYHDSFLSHMQISKISW